MNWKPGVRLRTWPSSNSIKRKPTMPVPRRGEVWWVDLALAAMSIGHRSASHAYKNGSEPKTMFVS